MQDSGKSSYGKTCYRRLIRINSLLPWSKTRLAKGLLVAAMQQIADWLKALGVSAYAERFTENKIEIAVLPDLTDQRPKDRGIALGHSSKMRRAIRDLGNASAAATAPAAIEPTRRDDAEHRRLTVMFCGLSGSTRFDPEDLHAVIGGHCNCVAETVVQFDEVVATDTGEGVLMDLSCPHARQDDAECAVGTGFSRIAAARELRLQAPFRMRIGVATGVVAAGSLIGSGEAQERGSGGEIPNLALRLQSVGVAVSLVLAASTPGLIDVLLEYKDLGAIEVKRFADRTRPERDRKPVREAAHGRHRGSAATRTWICSCAEGRPSTGIAVGPRFARTTVIAVPIVSGHVEIGLRPPVNERRL